MPLTDEETARVIERAIAGDRLAFAELYRAHVNALIRQCSAFSSLDADDVDDIVQETFVRAFKHLSRLRSASTLRPWLCSIARHRALTLVRRRAVQEECFAALPPEDEEVALIPAVIEREARAEVVREVIFELPAGVERDTVRMFYVDGTPTREIGTMHHVGKSAVTMRLDRFRTRIRPKLEQRMQQLDVDSP